MASLCYLMGTIYSIVAELFSVQPFSLFFTSIVLSVLFIANYHYAKQLCDMFFCGRSCGDTNVCGSAPSSFDFDYGLEKGPHKWKEMFPSAKGCYQSPVNIYTETTDILKISEPLTWVAYDELPSCVRIQNNGHTVNLRAEYTDMQPTLSGADLLECYSFVSLCFRWSLFDDEGSEHSVNDRRYPLELQAIHISRENSCFSPNHMGDIGVLILSYFFTTTKYDNPYLDPIILHLHAIREPNKLVEIPPFPLSWLCYPYRSGFYSYGGSLTEPPCTEGVTWFIQPEPMSISESQLTQFRQLLCKDGTRILKNSRPVQNLNSRIVCYNRFEQLERASPTDCSVENVENAE